MDLMNLDIPLVGATPSLCAGQALLLLPIGLSRVIVMSGHKVVLCIRRPITSHKIRRHAKK